MLYENFFSHAAIKISINATAAEFICRNIFPTPVLKFQKLKFYIRECETLLEEFLPIVESLR